MNPTASAQRPAPNSDLAAHLRRRLIPAVPVLLDVDGAIDAAAHERYVEWMAAQDVGGVAVWAHTGRGLHLNDEQRHDVLRAWRSVRMPVICGVGVPCDVVLPSDPAARTAAVIDTVVAMATAAKAGGAQAVMVHPPTPLRSSSDVGSRVVDVYRGVAEVGLPVLAFHLYEAVGGISFAPETVERLLSLDGVIGIKIATLDSVMMFQDLVAVVRGVPGSLVVTGEDRFLGYSLMLGADAALVGLGAACTDRSAALLAQWFRGEHAEFMRSLATVDEFARATFTAPMEGYIQRMIWALEADRVIPPGGRDPFGPALVATERDIVVAAVRDLRGR
jgi:4-hydroxy-tetrahydrodipicolinate synthase